MPSASAQVQFSVVCLSTPVYPSTAAPTCRLCSRLGLLCYTLLYTACHCTTWQRIAVRTKQDTMLQHIASPGMYANIALAETGPDYETHIGCSTQHHQHRMGNAEIAGGLYSSAEYIHMHECMAAVLWNNPIRQQLQPS